MPVVMEHSACGGSLALLPGVRCRSAEAIKGSATIEIGLVNNMPDAALQSTERQFIGLLAAASDKIAVRVHLFALPGVPRGAPARRYLASHYASMAALWNTRLDGLIVTGTEPRCADLIEEPYWAAFAELIDWARHNTQSTLWSCLAAHAAVLHLDGIKRHALDDKCFGVFACERTAHHALTAKLPALIEVPHSRWNGLAGTALDACGYQVLSRASAIGADLFVKEFGSLFVYVHGHPEYEPTTLLREYRRDIGRFLRGERDHYPAQPQRYFDRASTLALDGFRAHALTTGGEAVLDNFPAAVPQGAIVDAWRRCALRLYRNWIGTLATRRQAPPRRRATPTAPRPQSLDDTRAPARFVLPN